MRNKLLPVVFLLIIMSVAAILAGCQEPYVSPVTTMVAGNPGPEGLAPDEQGYPGGPAPAYPGATGTSVAYVPPGSPPPSGATPVAGTREARASIYLPALERAAPTETPSPVPTSTPSPTNTPVPTPTPTIDFQAVRETLRQNEQDLAFVKVGLHVGPGGNPTGLGVWMRRLDEAGVPFFLKSVDHAGPIWEAQEIVRNSDVPHTLVYRRSGPGFDHPDYSLPPAEAARRHWERHMAVFPPELDPDLIWLETMNEVNKGEAEWMGQFALESARLALANGFRWAAFGWATGEPEPEHWQTPSMLAFLRLAAANPDRLAIALHEYSLDPAIGHEYPYKVGRFQRLFEIADAHGIPRPTVLITEWGWEAEDVPGVGKAIDDIAWASRLYAQYPQVKGAALWYLGEGWGDIADRAQPLIGPLTEYALGNYFAIPQTAARAPITPNRYAPGN